MEPPLEDLEATATEDEATAVAKAGPQTAVMRSFERQNPVRAPLSAHLPRERVVIPAPCSHPECGGKLGEDITEALEVIPRRQKVIQTVREESSCRACERITQPPAPFHPIARGRAKWTQGSLQASAMKSMSAPLPKNAFDPMIDTALAEPLLIENHGRGVVMVIAVEEYERLMGLDAEGKTAAPAAEAARK